MKRKTRTTIMYTYGVCMIALGLLLNYFDLGDSSFQAFGSVGNWLVYIGFFGIILATVKLLVCKKEKVIDERMEFIVAKANRITFLCLFLVAFVIMIVDGIRPITTPYHLFMSYLVCGLLLVHISSYKILSRFY